MRIFFSAGEASGDALGAHLIRELSAAEPGFRAVGFGGPLMSEAGLECHHDLTRHAIMGLLPVIRHLPTIFRLLRETARRFDENPPDALVPIDYPGMNLVLARMARRRGIPVLYYVSPQLWAWGRWRVAKLRRRVDRLLAILPFEAEFFVQRGIPTVYVGHPLVDRLADLQVPRTVSRKIRGGGESHLVGVLPGSRLQEVDRLLPVMMQVARALHFRVPGIRFVLPAPGEAHPRGRRVREILARDPASPIQIADDHPHAVMKLARVCLVASGTATAELAYFKTPMVILYRVGRLARIGARFVIRVPNIGMANILARRRVVPEFLFATPPPIDRIVQATEELLLDEGKRAEAIAGLDEVRRALGEPGASRRAADEILRFVGGSGLTGRDWKSAAGSKGGGSVSPR